SLVSPCNAQSALWGAIKGKVEQKASQVVTGEMDGSARNQRQDDMPSSRDDVAPRRQMLGMHSGDTFASGNRTLFRDDFASTGNGHMPGTWKTNGSGEVVTLDGEPGKWLKLQNFATYKLAKPVSLPARFTLEFDVIVVAEKVNDLSTFAFGFAKDNSVRTYMQDAYNDGALNAVSLHYMNGDDGTVASSASGKHHPIDFDLEGYANRPMHVAIAVDGDRMQVYLDRTKIADTQLFRDNSVRYFFLSAPIRSEHGASLVVSNFRMDGYQ
ncbi:MAG: hypothetical protein ACTS5I_17260, partial [Rhodanobacter sp.]